LPDFSWLIHSLKLTAKAPESRPFKGSFFLPSIFRAYVCSREGMSLEMPLFSSCQFLPAQMLD